MEEDVQGRGSGIKRPIRSIRPIRLSGAAIKTAALVSMFIDHIAVMFLTDGTLVYEIFRGIGRMAFPIFCFMAAEGMVHTRNKYRYMLRMAVFALVSQPVYVYLFDGLNVMFTFLLGMMTIAMAEGLSASLSARLSVGITQKKTKHAAGIYGFLCFLSALITVLVFAILAEVSGISYGAIGIVVICADYYLLKGQKVKTAAFASPLLCAFSIAQIPALLSAVPLALYSGEKGRQNKWFFYAFYPAHIFLLVIIKVFILCFHS